MAIDQLFTMGMSRSWAVRDVGWYEPCIVYLTPRWIAGHLANRELHRIMRMRCNRPPVKKGENMSATDRDTSQPPIDWVDTTAGGENEPGDASVAGSPGSGANDITCAGFPNADPDGYDISRSDLQGIDPGENPTGDEA